jgi:hypothetical protein
MYLAALWIIVSSVPRSEVENQKENLKKNQMQTETTTGGEKKQTFGGENS